MDLATVDHLLTTTRSVRKRLDFDRPVDPAVITRCLEIAIQAPTGSNSQGWHFIVVTDAAKRKAIADLYHRGFEMYRAMNEAPPPQLREGDPRREQTLRIIDSAAYLAENLHRAPVFILACIEGRVENGGVIAQASIYGSVLPSVWSLMLALRARGLGSAWTTLHLLFEQDVAALLDIPATVTQAALLPVAHFTGTDFKPAKRLPLRTFVHHDGWRRQG
jgi:nitroreductase